MLWGAIMCYNECMDKEIWKEIPSIPDFEASSLGRIRRIRNRKNCAPDGIIKARVMNAGYYIVHLNYKGRVYARLVHRLVAEVFLGICPKGQEVNHKDFDRLNNVPDNLEYIPCSINQVLQRNGRAGENNPCAKVTQEQVAQIRELHATGMGYTRISKTLSISWSIVRAILSGRTWKNV